MSKEKNQKLKALKLTIEKLEKTYGKGAVMKLGDVKVDDVASPSQMKYAFRELEELVDNFTAA